MLNLARLIGLLLLLVPSHDQNKKGQKGERHDGQHGEGAPHHGFMRTPQNQKPNSDSAQKPPTRFWRDYGPLDKFTFFLMIFTGLLAVIGGFQVWSFVQSERAFVTIVSGDIRPMPLLADRPFTITLMAKNSGHSHAVVESLRLFTRVISALPAKPDYSGKFTPKPRQPILPDGTWPTTFTRRAHPDTVKEISSKKARFYVYGVLEYTDGFSLFGPRTTGFCYVFNPDGDPTQSVFDPCPEIAYTWAD